MNNKSGFTLLEILMVITIVGVIGAVFGAQMSTVTKSWEVVEDNIAVHQELTDTAKFIGMKMESLKELTSITDKAIKWVSDDSDSYKIYYDAVSVNVVYETSTNYVVLCENVVTFSILKKVQPLTAGSSLQGAATVGSTQVLDFYISKKDKNGKFVGVNVLHFLRDSIRGEFGVDTTLYYEFFNVSDNITSGVYVGEWHVENGSPCSYVRLKWPKQLAIAGKYTVASLNFSLQAESTTVSVGLVTINHAASDGTCNDLGHGHSVHRFHFNPSYGWEPCTGISPACPMWGQQWPDGSWHVGNLDWDADEGRYRRYKNFSPPTYNLLNNYSVSVNMAFLGDLYLEIDSMIRTDYRVSGNDLWDGIDDADNDLYRLNDISANIGYVEISVEYIETDDFFVYEFWGGASGLGKDSTQNLRVVFDARQTNLSFSKY